MSDAFKVKSECSCITGDITAFALRPSSESLYCCSKNIIHRTIDGECEIKKIDPNLEISRMAFSPKGSRFIIGTSDHCIYLYTSSDIVQNKLVVRAKNALVDFDFSSDGIFLAYSTNNSEINIVDMSDTKNKSLTQASGPTKTIKFKPNHNFSEEEFLVAVCHDRSLKIWTFKSADFSPNLKLSPYKTIENVFPTSLIKGGNAARVRWNHKGTFLALPGLNGVKFLNAKLWEVDFELSDPNRNLGELDLISWSPSDDHIVTANSKTGDMFVWDLCVKSIVAEKHFEKCMRALLWVDKINFSVAFKDGKVLHLEFVKNEPYTFEDKAPEKRPIKRGLVLDSSESEGEDSFEMVDDLEKLDESSQKNKRDPPVLNIDSSSDSDPPLNNEKQDIEKSESDVINEAVDDFIVENKSDGLYFSKYRKKLKSNVAIKSSPPREKIVKGKVEVAEIGSNPLMGVNTKSQEAFASGSTPFCGDRRYLVWNLCGSVVLIRDSETESYHVDIEFSDISLYKPDLIEEKKPFDFACLTEKAVLLCATKQNSESGKALIYLKSLKATDLLTEWSLECPQEEDIVCVTLGDSFVVVGTSLYTLRVFSLSGLQKKILQMPGAIVTLSTNSKKLAVVYHRGLAHRGNQNLGLKVFDLGEEEAVCSTNLPISKDSFLLWVGLNEIDMTVTVDSKLIVRGLLKSFGGEWAVLGDLNGSLGSSDTFWPIGCFLDKFVGVVCEKKLLPSVTPKPVVTTLDLRIPIIHSGNTSGSKVVPEVSKREEESLRHSIFFKEYQLPKDSSRAREYRAKIDKSLYAHFYYVCGAQPSKSLDIAKSINTPKALNLCIECARQNDQDELVEKLKQLQIEKFG